MKKEELLTNIKDLYKTKEALKKSLEQHVQKHIELIIELYKIIQTEDDYCFTCNKTFNEIDLIIDYLDKYCCPICSKHTIKLKYTIN